MKKNVMDVIIKIEEITDLLYKQEKRLAYSKLNNAIADLSSLIDQLFQLSSQNELINFDIHSMVSKLGEALQAMQDEDNVLLADILQYEIKEQLQEICNNMET